MRVRGMGAGEHARYWRHPAIPGMDLLAARYVRHAFSRHTHDTFVIAAITSGVEEFHHRGSIERAGPGDIALVNPDTSHTGYAGVADGWSYRVLYPAVGIITDVAADISPTRGTPAFTTTVVSDQQVHRMVTAVHRAAERDQMLAADTLLRLAVARLLRMHSAASTNRAPRSAGALTAARARDILEQRMTDPPGLEDLAAELGTRPFPLLRAFRDAYGLPPHTWLTGVRVRRARELLDTGVRLADVAMAVGFHDQPHLNRHFARVVGVPPGAYARERKNVQDSSASTRLRCAGEPNQEEKFEKVGHRTLR